MKTKIFTTFFAIILVINTLSATNWVECYKKGFPIYYNSDKRIGEVELKDEFPVQSDRQEMALWAGSTTPIASIIWRIEVSSDGNQFRILSIKGFDESNNYICDCPITWNNINYSKWQHKDKEMEAVYRIHGWLAIIAKTYMDGNQDIKL